MLDNPEPYVTAHEDGTIVSGRARVFLMANMGATEIPVQIVDENNRYIRVEVREIARLK